MLTGKSRCMSLAHEAARWFSAFVHLLFPRRCVVCGAVLGEGEEGLCLKCDMDMPRTGLHLVKDNRVERMFWGKFPIEHASAFFYYRKGSGYSRLLHQLKYEGRDDLGLVMGRRLAAELKSSGFFDGVDVLLPVPLHPQKQRLRGYNQSACIARGISVVTGIGVDTTSVVRAKYTETQTHKSAYERWENVEGIFRVLHPDYLCGKHVMLVDDVLTTGATMTACADALCCVEGIRISILALAVAGD